MGLLKVQAFDAGPTSSGVSISQGETRSKAFFRIGMTAAAQLDLCGRALVIGKDALAFVLTDDPEHRHLMGIKLVPIADSDGVAVSGGIKGSISVKVLAWKPASGKHPAVSLPVINRQVVSGGFSVKLPDWAQPAADRGAAARRVG